MSATSSPSERILTAAGPAALTMVGETSEDRRLLPEISLAAAGLWLLGKYLDGVINGLGGNPAEKLGQFHGALVRRAVTSTISVMKDALTGKRRIDASDVATHDLAMEAAISAVQSAGTQQDLGTAGKAVVVEELKKAGLPAAEAERIATGIEGAIWKD